MIPIRLEFSGVASYQNRVSIDFSTLISGRLFGIFGPVGSGKSAILDAMSYVLYGWTDRLGSQNSAYNLMNLQSDSMEIEFEFSVNSQRYLFTFSQKRQKKDFTKMGKSERAAYTWEQNSWIPLEERGERLAERILGIGYDNFRRTVIIPQGKFHELLHISGTDRTKMLQELFQLDKYDLSDGVKEKLTQTREELIRIKTRLEAMGSVTQESILEKENQAKRLYAQVEGLKKELVAARQAEQFLQKTLESVTRHGEVVEQLTARRAQLKRGEAELQEMESQSAALIVEVENHPKVDTHIQELERCLVWKEEEAEFLSAQEECQKLRTQVEERKSRIDEGKKCLLKLEADQQELKTHLIKPEELMPLSAWFQEWQRIAREIGQEEHPKGDLSIEEQHLYERWIERELLSGNTYQEERARLEDTLTKIKERYQAITVDHRIEQLSKELEQGKPCPLCGSLEHPRVDQTQESVGAEKERLEGEIAELNFSLAALDRAYTHKKLLQQQIDQRANYRWESICPMELDAFEQLRVDQKRFSYQLERVDGELGSQRKQLDTLHYQFQQLEERKNRLELRVAQLQEKQNGLDQALLSTYGEESVRVLRDRIQELSTRMEQEKKRYQELLQKEQKHRDGIAKVGGIIEELDRQESSLAAVIAAESPRVNTILATHKIPTLKEWTLGDMVEPIQEEYDDLNLEYRELEQQILGEKKLLAESKELTRSLSLLEEREERLNLLKGLFHGRGFVHYVSQRYLTELCARANERFMLFTRNAMRLELDPKSGDILVRDHYNNGQLRSVKTLSGGQTFQASFSFALAMVEMVGRGEENFFFLDEGFGTLDNEALETVFQTLSSMYKERKIVGIISHVESLKEEIPVYLEVSTHSQSGSRVDLVIR